MSEILGESTLVHSFGSNLSRAPDYHLIFKSSLKSKQYTNGLQESQSDILKIILYAGYNEDFDEVFQLLCPKEINNSNEFSLDNTSFEANDFMESYENLQNLEDEITRDKSCVSQVRPSVKKRGRPKTIMTENLSRERRDAATARERKRMNEMTRHIN